MLFLFSKLCWRSCLFGTDVLAFLAMVLLLGSMAHGQFEENPPANDQPPETPTTVAPKSAAEPDKVLAPVDATGKDAKDNKAKDKEADLDFEVLTSGPIHEAFARPVDLDPKPGPLVKKQPPEPIDELPPDQQPSGKQIEWIPGYWTWNDERQDYVWASGVWRDIPPGRRWVPGYWTQDAGGHRWISGFWAAGQADQVEYLPQPPATLEEGPNSLAPSPDHFWIPGSWVFAGGRYAWQPGFWSLQHADWIWVPRYYSWTPRGCVSNGGYWDFTIARRGLAFAPLYFHHPIYTHAGYHYTPSICFDSGLFTFHLFAHSHYGHYYFGDYYGDHHAAYGIHPWVSHHRNRTHYDPLYTHQSWHHKRHGNDLHWDRTVQQRYRHYRDHADARPARTLAESKTRIERGPKGKGQQYVRSLDELSKGRGTDHLRTGSRRAGVRIESLSDARRGEIRSQSQRWQQFRRARSAAEAVAKSGAKTGDPRPASATRRSTRGRRETTKFQLPDRIAQDRSAARSRPSTRSSARSGSTARTPRSTASRRSAGKPSVAKPNVAKPSVGKPSVGRSTARPPIRRSPRSTTRTPTAKTPATRAPVTRSPSVATPRTRAPSARTPRTKAPSTRTPTRVRPSAPNRNPVRVSPPKRTAKRSPSRSRPGTASRTPSRSGSRPAIRTTPRSSPRSSVPRSSTRRSPAPRPAVSRPSAARSSGHRSAAPRPRASAPSRPSVRSVPRSSVSRSSGHSSRGSSRGVSRSRPGTASRGGGSKRGK